MSIKLFSERNVAQVPKATTVATYQAPNGRKYSKEVTVTHGGSLRWDRLTPDSFFEGEHVDLLIEIEKYRIAIFLFHPEHSPFINLDFWRSRRCGVIAIDLSRAGDLFASRNAVESAGGYRNCLAKFLFESDAGKRWLTHPREQSAVAQSLPLLHEEADRDSLHQDATNDLHLLDNIETLRARELGTIIAPTVVNPVHAECVKCGRSWQGTEPGLNACENCKTHLYVKTSEIK